ncbi:hypothetical protein [uncultured Deinococcus sp.]|uniref:hypothetical protein n=1 Tax=uncultured Deinococcus sp. TaxID=158789 RepID=UPI00258A88AF|nr:hypothetical protein [uncultured Deinococcus sp.]
MSSADLAASGTTPTDIVQSGSEDVYSDKIATLHNIPMALQDRPQWVGVKLWQEDGKPKPTKLPKCIKNGQLQNAKVSEPDTWTTFQAAHGLAASHRVDGVGFVLRQEDGLVIIDLDKYLNPATGELDEWAKELLAKFPTYTEISQSGTGLHLVLWGQKPAKGVKSGQIEIYSDKRFIWMTGHVLSDRPTKVTDCQAALDELMTSLQPADAPLPFDIAAHSQPKSPFSDEQILSRLKKAKNGRKLTALYDTGQWAAAGYPV